MLPLCTLPVGWQYAEGVKLAAERGDHPKVALVGGENLVGVVAVGQDGVEGVGDSDLQVAVACGQAAGGSATARRTSRIASESGCLAAVPAR